jgi:hypothetical protein
MALTSPPAWLQARELLPANAPPDLVGIWYAGYPFSRSMVSRKFEEAHFLTVPRARGNAVGRIRLPK